MRMYEIIRKKRDGLPLSQEEIAFVIGGVVSGEIPDYQISAWLMAAFIKGLSTKEAVDLTLAMAHSGDVVDLSPIAGVKVDKHSTGGVGDKLTLILGPLVAACGAVVAKMSGRGLGHTGGTIDKLEAIPGFSTSLSAEAFVSAVNRIGIAIAGQTGNLAPADKSLYALRDVTATVESAALIAASVMSKKLASGADAIVLDVKAGSGAFMKTVEEAAALARMMVDIGNGAGKKTVAYVTNMEEPLGCAIGNALEVREAIETLSGRGPEDIRALCVELGAGMLVLAHAAPDLETARRRLSQALDTGAALQKFGKLVRQQGGDPAVVQNLSLLPRAETVEEAPYCGPGGYVQSIDAEAIGIAALTVGAGRRTKEDTIDLAAGIVLHKKIGDTVRDGEVLFTLHHNRHPEAELAKSTALAAFAVGAQAPERQPLVYGVVE